MSKRAEQKALEVYPEKTVIVYGPYPTTEPSQIDDNKCYRDGFIKGYEQAEKDLALTIEDLRLIHTFLYAFKNNKHGAFTFTRLSDEQYQEVLNRFNKSKEGKK